MNNQFLIMQKLKDSLKGLDEAAKNAEADRAALIMRIDAIESDLLKLSALVDLVAAHTQLNTDELLEVRKLLS